MLLQFLNHKNSRSYRVNENGAVIVGHLVFAGHDVAQRRDGVLLVRLLQLVGPNRETRLQALSRSTSPSPTDGNRRAYPGHLGGVSTRGGL